MIASWIVTITVLLVIHFLWPVIYDSWPVIHDLQFVTPVSDAISIHFTFNHIFLSCRKPCFLWLTFSPTWRSTNFNCTCRTHSLSQIMIRCGGTQLHTLQGKIEWKSLVFLVLVLSSFSFSFPLWSLQSFFSFARVLIHFITHLFVTGTLSRSTSIVKRDT